MKSLIAVVAAFILISFVPAHAADTPALRASVSGSLVFVGSSDAPGAMEQDRLKTCLQRLAQEMKVADKPMPRILVLHVSKPVAAAVELAGSTVRSNTGRGGGAYYELWLVGKVTPDQYLEAMTTILETHFKLHYADTERKQLMTRVLRYLQMTVSAKAYGE